jgi:hypothetical protein
MTARCFGRLPLRLRLSQDAVPRIHRDNMTAALPSRSRIDAMIRRRATGWPQRTRRNVSGPRPRRLRTLLDAATLRDHRTPLADGRSGALTSGTRTCAFGQRTSTDNTDARGRPPTKRMTARVCGQRGLHRPHRHRRPLRRLQSHQPPPRRGHRPHRKRAAVMGRRRRPTRSVPEWTTIRERVKRQRAANSL